ncbi:hypothetical protein BDY19DRAFT_193994 [Irpex rosettiformis]|uniref:Uncharacterized protein n=1 Tax=Irpex rosettiformis TaxID=378272 RepID=A0ACB8U295_9APHY|nr:hypothetical protein BDY19DRAFT_193994 [Irpex rosettiformis]
MPATPRHKKSSRRADQKQRKAKTAAPTEEEWETMERQKSVVVGGRTFQEKDDVVLHSREKAENAWVASLRQIRMRRDEEIWIRVRWYQSPHNIAEIINSFDPGMFCRMERAPSDQSDILSAGCLKEVTHVHHFRENTLKPLDISPNDFFQRYSVGFETRDITPIPGSFTCLPECAKPYHPFPCTQTRGKRGKYLKISKDDDEIDLTWDVMHMCPRPQCGCRWYHRSCLIRAGYIDRDSAADVGDRRARLLAADPDSEDLHPSVVNPALLKTQETLEMKPGGISSVLGSLSTYVSAKLGHLPPELVEIAAQPIVRCATRPKLLSNPRLGTFSTAGNVKEVVLARRLVYQALDGGHEQLQQFCTQQPHTSDGQHLEDLELDVWQAQPDSIRVFASPRQEFWQRRAGLSEFSQDLDRCPPIFCPQCGNPV